MANQTEVIKKKLIEQRVKAPKLSPVAQKGAQMDTLKQAVMPKGYNSKDVLAKRHYTGGKIDPDKMFGGRGLQAIGQGAMPEDEWHDVDLGNSESQNMDGMTSDVMPANGANSGSECVVKTVIF
jgi:hypothetical protein